MNSIDLFAGPGGWDLGAGELGIQPLGIELDDDACATRAAAGLRTEQLDVAAAAPESYAPCDLLIASPPCQGFSAAGKRGGHTDLPRILEALRALASEIDQLAEIRGRCIDERSLLVVEPYRWALKLKPRRIALEQVPEVLPIWRMIERHLHADRYWTWSGVLNAADYGVPQTRRRAFLLASLDGPVGPPKPTHHRDGSLLLDGEWQPQWVSMAEALGWGMTERPYPVIATSRNTGGPDKEKVGGSGARATLYAERDEGRWLAEVGHVNTGRDWKPEGTREDAQAVPASEPAPTLSAKAPGQWHMHRPATTLMGDSRVFSPGGHTANDGRDNSKMVGRSENAIRITVDEASALQSFPPGYPWRGTTKTGIFRQIGNAVPPLLALRVLEALLA